MNKSKNNSLDWLVAARGYVMYGIFVGHLMISLINDGHYTSLIYPASFLEPLCVPFFAILVGAFYSRGNKPFLAYARLKFSQRILPVFFYLLLILPFYLFSPLPGKTAADSLRFLPLYLLGIPLLSLSSWFLVALFSSEMLYFFIQPLAKKALKTAGLALAMFSLGWLYNDSAIYMPDIVGMLGMVWMLHAVPVFCGFFLVGLLAKPWIMKMGSWPYWKVAGIGLVSAVIGTLAVNFNEFNVPPRQSFFHQFISGELMMLSAGQYGQFPWFLLSCLCWPLSLLCLARLLPVTRFMRACGDHSLVLLGLNGIFQNVLNVHIATGLYPLENVAWQLMPYVLIIAGISMAVCLPVAICLEKYLPQLTGRPMLVGPLLPALYRK